MQDYDFLTIDGVLCNDAEFSVEFASCRKHTIVEGRIRPGTLDLRGRMKDGDTFPVRIDMRRDGKVSRLAGRFQADMAIEYEASLDFALVSADDVPPIFEPL